MQRVFIFSLAPLLLLSAIHVNGELELKLFYRNNNTNWQWKQKPLYWSSILLVGTEQQLSSREKPKGTSCPVRSVPRAGFRVWDQITRSSPYVILTSCWPWRYYIQKNPVKLLHKLKVMSLATHLYCNHVNVQMVSARQRSRKPEFEMKVNWSSGLLPARQVSRGYSLIDGRTDGRTRRSMVWRSGHCWSGGYWWLLVT